MSCSFWLRRHNAAAKKRREAREKAEAEKQATVTEEKVFSEEPVITTLETKKPRKKAVKKDDNA